MDTTNLTEFELGFLAGVLATRAITEPTLTDIDAALEVLATCKADLASGWTTMGWTRELRERSEAVTQAAGATAPASDFFPNGLQRADRLSPAMTGN